MNSEPLVPASTAPCPILSLDGGGAKGFYTLGVLKEIEATAHSVVDNNMYMISYLTKCSTSSTLVALFVGFNPVCAAETVGPEKGRLIIHGGGAVSNEIKKLFVALAGGNNAHFVLIPTAMSEEEIGDGGFIRGQGRGWAKSWGINHVTMLHTRDKAVANSEYLIDALRKASGVWIMGGRQWRLADAYLNTAVEREMKELVARGGVVGGSSAGATIQGSFLVRGDPKSNDIMMSPGHERGFGLLSNSAIDQHVNTREREHDLVKVIEKHPELLGLGIDEGAAIVVHADSSEVVDGQVAVYGNGLNGAFHYSMSSGQVFNLKERILVK